MSLEIRDFPKGLSMTAYEKLLVLCRDGLKNCINMRRCSWTRDGSVNSWILRALQECRNLVELELNGNHNSYDAILLREFDSLQKISLILPSANVLDMLPSWIRVTGPTLRSLTLICKVRSKYDVPVDFFSEFHRLRAWSQTVHCSRWPPTSPCWNICTL
jgi:hypothetical protein